jgi:hypothetical protein
VCGWWLFLSVLFVSVVVYRFCFVCVVDGFIVCCVWLMAEYRVSFVWLVLHNMAVTCLFSFDATFFKFLRLNLNRRNSV